MLTVEKLTLPHLHNNREYEKKTLPSRKNLHHPISTEKIEETELEFLINDAGHPMIACDKNNMHSIHTSLFSLSKILPEVIQSKNQTLLAKIINFLVSGVQFEIIENPESYKTSYKSQYEAESNSFDFLNLSLISYGKFNVDEVSTPYIKKGETGKKNVLIFYVKNTLPYRVTCELPIDQAAPKCHYELLPYSDS